MGHLALPSPIPATSRPNRSFPRVAARRPAGGATRRPTRLFCLLAGCGLTLALLASGRAADLPVAESAPAPTPESVLTRFAGTWRWVGGPGELHAIDDAIEGCVKQMNLFIRPIARLRIRKPLQPSSEMVLALAPGPGLSISRPDRPTIVIPSHGQPIPWRDPGGESFLISLAIARGTLQQRFEGTSSVSFNSYLLDPSGRKLTVHTRIVSRRLPAPIEFDTTYQKSP